MKLFKTVDERLEDIGFKRAASGNGSVRYTRPVRNNTGRIQYTQCMDLLKKESGEHICLSYDEQINTDGLNNVVGLTAKEMKLAYKKMRQLGLA